MVLPCLGSIKLLAFGWFAFLLTLGLYTLQHVASCLHWLFSKPRMPCHCPKHPKTDPVCLWHLFSQRVSFGGRQANGIIANSFLSTKQKLCYLTNHGVCKWFWVSQKSYLVSTKATAETPPQPMHKIVLGGRFPNKTGFEQVLKRCY